MKRGQSVGMKFAVLSAMAMVIFHLSTAVSYAADEAPAAPVLKTTGDSPAEVKGYDKDEDVATAANKLFDETTNAVNAAEAKKLGSTLNDSPEEFSKVVQTLIQALKNIHEKNKEIDDDSDTKRQALLDNFKLAFNGKLKDKDTGKTDREAIAPILDLINNPKLVKRKDALKKVLAKLSENRDDQFKGVLAQLGLAFEVKKAEPKKKPELAADAGPREEDAAAKEFKQTCDGLLARSGGAIDEMDKFYRKLLNEERKAATEAVTKSMEKAKGRDSLIPQELLAARTAPAPVQPPPAPVAHSGGGSSPLSASTPPLNLAKDDDSKDNNLFQQLIAMKKDAEDAAAGRAAALASADTDKQVKKVNQALTLAQRAAQQVNGVVQMAASLVSDVTTGKKLAGQLAAVTKPSVKAQEISEITVATGGNGADLLKVLTAQRSKVTGTQSDLLEKQALLAANLQPLKDKAALYSDQKEELSAKIAQLGGSEVQKLQSEIDKLDSGIAKMERDPQYQDSLDLSSQKQQLEDAQNRMAELTAGNEQINALRAKEKSLAKQIESLDSSIATVTTQQTQVEAALKAAKDKVAEFDTALASAKQQADREYQQQLLQTAQANSKAGVTKRAIPGAGNAQVNSGTGLGRSAAPRT